MDKVKFLMSDTSAEVTAACREALELKGVEVTVVEKDGLKVLQKMLSVRPQVVLLDAFMPGLDALAVKQKYNAAGERHTAFFVTGAFQSEEMVQELLDEGFAYYFVKPFDENVLASRVLKVALGHEKRSGADQRGQRRADRYRDFAPDRCPCPHQGLPIPAGRHPPDDG